MGTHECRLDVPLPIDWHACRHCEQPVFEVAGVCYDDVTIRIKHECAKPQVADTRPSLPIRRTPGAI